MRRREQAHAQTGRAINALQHRARRTFAIRAGDMDETKFLLRIASERCELERRFQTKVRAEDLEALEELDGVRVGQSFLLPALTAATGSIFISASPAIRRVNGFS